MESIRFSFNLKNLLDVPFQKYQKDFTFIVNGKQYQTNRFIADLLSPILRNAHFIDSSIDKYYINTNNIKDKTTKIPAEDYFDDFLNIFSYHNSAIPTKQLKYFSAYFYLLGNIDGYLALQPRYNQEITIENAVDLLISMTPIIIPQIECISGRMKEIISFIAAHFEEIDKQKLKELSVEYLEEILHHESLKLLDEDSLFQFVLSLYAADQSYSVLFEYINFSNLSDESIKLFIKSFDINRMNQPIWQSICSRLLHNVNIKSNNINNNNNDYNNYNNNLCKNDNFKYSKEQIQLYNNSNAINDQNCVINNDNQFKGTSNDFESLISDSYDDYDYNEANDKESAPIDKGHGLETYEDEIIESSNDENVKIFKHLKNNEFNGIMHYLTKEKGGNIHDNGTIEITSNSINSDSISNHPKNLVDYDSDNLYCSKDEGGAIIRFDFKDKLVELSSYSIKSYNCGKNWSHLKNWSIEISDDGVKWEEIDHHENDPTLNGDSVTATFCVSKNIGFHRFVQLRQTGFSWSKHSSNRSIIIFPLIEFYGKLKIL